MTCKPLEICPYKKSPAIVQIVVIQILIGDLIKEISPKLVILIHNRALVYAQLSSYFEDRFAACRAVPRSFLLLNDIYRFSIV